MHGQQNIKMLYLGLLPSSTYHVRYFISQSLYAS